MNVLITGGTGFIGRYLVESLATQNKVYVLSRRETFFHPRVTTIISDLTDSNFTNQLPSNIDSVVHLAQSNMYREFPRGVSDVFRVNITATLELLEWSRLNKVKKFLFTSSANVYSPCFNLLSENSRCVPTSFYGVSKLSAEHLIQQYQKYFQTDILRCFTVYGSSQQNMLISNMIDRIKNGLEITLANGVGVYLTPIYIEDIIQIINKVLNLPRTKESRILNACGNDVLSLAEIIYKIQKILGKRAVVTNSDEEPSYFIGSNEKLKDLINGLNLMPFDKGIKNTLKSMM